MKIRSTLLALIFLLFLGACNNPIVVPADLAVTLPPNQDFLLRASLTPPADAEAPALPTSTLTATLTPAPSATPTPSPTPSPRPTRKSPYPAAMGTPLVDLGFEPLNLDNLPTSGLAFAALSVSPREAVASADGLKLFLETSDGLYVFDKQGAIIGHWPGIQTAAAACESCLSVTRDGSRIAVISRQAGSWEAQVYDLQSSPPALLLSLPIDNSFQGSANEASIAISPDGNLLAFKAGAGRLRALDLQTKLQVLGYDRPVTGLAFTPDGSRFIIHSGLEMLFYQVDGWKPPANLLLPRADAPYAISPDGKLLAVALPTKMRIYTLDKLSLLREINVPPSNADQREWRLAFKDAATLAGYSVTWDARHASAKVETGTWNIETGQALGFETSTSTAPDAASWLWGAALSLPSAPAELENFPAGYPAFRFVSDGLLLVNSPHSACWLQLFTGESNCQADAARAIFATDGASFIEQLDPSGTRLLDRSGTEVFALGPYRIAALSRAGDWVLIDNGSGTDLYTKGKKLPQESVSGKPQGFAENSKQIVFTALEKENSFTITVVDKTTGNAIFQKKDNFLYRPILMLADGTIYYLQNELDHNQTILNRIDPLSLQTSEVTRLSLPSAPTALTLSTGDLFAIGQRDGSVLVMTRDGGQSVVFQAATGPVLALAFSPDGHFLAVGSADGLRVYAILPGAK